MEKIKKFTDALVKSLKPTTSRHDLTEGNGFCLRISATGKKSWVYSYWFEGKSKRYKMGTYPAIGVADARKLFNDAMHLKEKGIDPIEHEKQLKLEAELQKQKNIQTMEWLSEEFYKSILINRKRPEQVRQQLDADIIPSLGSIHIDDILTRDITQALQKIVDRGSLVHANKVLSTIKQMFNFALSQGITDRNPSAAIRARDVGGVEQSRNRPLSYAEIKQVLNYLDGDKHSMYPATVIGLKILLLTGVRTGSLIQAKWKEFDLAKNTWVIPPEHQKLKKTQPHNPFIVHLSDWVKELLGELKEQSNSKFLFPHAKATRQDDQHAERTVFSSAVRNKIEEIGIPKFNPHDFRATLATRLSEESIAPHIVELILGHQLGGVAGIYNRHQYLNERKDALNLWSEKIRSIVQNSNVVAFNG